MKKCPNCTNLMPEDITRCIRCGFDSPRKAPPVSSGALVAPGAAGPKRSRFANGWALARQSFRVLMLDKQLLLFPLLSGIASLLVLASFIGGAWASGIAERKEAMSDATGWLLLFAYYFANYFVIVFFNSALAACAMLRFRGGTPTLAFGLREARARLGQIVAWALFAASVGVLLQMIAERIGFLGKIVIGVLGAAWTVATYFVVPVLVVEKLGPLDAARRSASIVRESWGESLVSNVGIGLVSMLVTVLLIIPTAVAFLVLAIKMASIAVALVGVAVVLLMIVIAALVGSALSSITLVALYLYATEGKVPQAYADTGLQHAFAARA
jgi:hypothetical protein